MTRALLPFLFFFGIPWPTSAEEAKPLTAILIVARDELPDPNFKDSIVLVMNNIGPFPAGVIVNRPTRITVSQLFPEIKGLAQVRDKVYFGGPVEIGAVSYIFTSDTTPENAIRVTNGVYFSENGKLLRELLGRDKPMDGLRILIGHSEWGPGQLEAEISRGDWKLAPADKDAIFNSKPEHPWPEKPASEGQSGT
jgi:putative transcriptional regulator